MRPLSFAAAYAVALSVALGLVLGGPFLAATPVLVFVLVPLLDALLPLDESPPREIGPGARHVFDAWLLLWVPVQVLLVAACLHEVVLGSRASWERALLVVDLGLSNGAIGITVAHELMHRASRLHQALAEALMTLVSYPHFCIEHVLGHHRAVATPRDPATSRRGESLYRFLPRTLAGGLASAWRLESARSERRGLAAISLRDRRLRLPLGLALLYGGTFAWLGVPGALALAGQGLVAVLLLEVINYVEHYGLVRAVVDGTYEPVSPRHSWNSSQRASGTLLFELTRHSDHHAVASRPYWLLRHVSDAPQLPAGYPVMVLVATVPPLWRRVMDPLLDDAARRGNATHGSRSLAAEPPPAAAGAAPA